MNESHGEDTVSTPFGPGVADDPAIIPSAVEELHARIPDYRIPEDEKIHFSPGIRQADPLPLEFSPA